MAEIQKGPWPAGIPGKAIKTFLSAGMKVLRNMERNCTTYKEIRLWAGTSWPVISRLSEDGLKEAILTILISCHDYYVLTKNAMRPKRGPSGSTGIESPCKRCGQCCIGPAKGPLSWRKEEIIGWEEENRDDILYFTAYSGPLDVPRASCLKFLTCPFLRFNQGGLGLCLIHPLKPKECLEFVCDNH